jgi:hydroxyethylthiazole kinase-like sugar kinase family protein
MPTFTARNFVGDVCLTFDPVDVLATSMRKESRLKILKRK